MALVLGTNCGFVTVAPVDDPSAANVDIDNYSRATKDTSPATAVKITEIGWWCGWVEEDTNYEVGVYTDDAGNVEPETLIGSSKINATGGTKGWKRVTGLNIVITPETIYWLGLQVDESASGTYVDYVSSGGSDAIRQASCSALPDPNWDIGGILSENGMLAIYAVWEAAGVVKELAGLSVISSTTAGVLKATRELAGTTIISSTITGELSKAGIKELAGAVAIASTVVGELVSPIRELAGTVAIESTCAAEVKRTRGISGAVTIASIITGELSKATLQALSGIVAITSTVSGELFSQYKLLAGKIAIASSVVGELVSIAKGRTYFTYENGKIVFYVAGCEAMRIKADGTVDVKGTVTENAF